MFQNSTMKFRAAPALAVATVSGLLVSILLAVNVDAAADDGPCVIDPKTGACIRIDVPGPDPDDDADPTSGNGGSAGCRDKGGNQVPCTKDGMTWYASHNCYAEPFTATNMPPPDGKKRSDGRWMICADSTVTSGPWWIDNGDRPVPPVNPVAVATRLLVRLPFEFADANIAPPPTHHTYIRYENWMWIDDNQWGTVSNKETLRGATVTLTATPTHVEWNMGNGDTKSCVGPGRVWVTGMAENTKSNCSYPYNTMNDPKGDTWTVTARINYTLAWTCTGNCGGQHAGDLGSQLAAAGDPTTITVHQRQTVVKN